MAVDRNTEPQLDLHDIQGDILVGLQKDFEWFLFFDITDRGEFKRFAARVLLPKITTACKVLEWELMIQAHKRAGQPC